MADGMIILEQANAQFLCTEDPYHCHVPSFPQYSILHGAFQRMNGRMIEYSTNNLS